MSTVRRCLCAGAVAVTAARVAAGQSSVAVSPFMSYVPSAASNPLAGMALTFGGTTGLAFRGSSDISLSNPSPTTTTTSAGSATSPGVRPWAADADAMLFLGGLGGGATMFSHALAPYLFTGLGMVGADSSGANVVHNGWSYGAGATIPLGFDADIFGEARWRMSRYVLPTSHDAPSSKSELRFGLSFHVGGSRESARPERRRGRYQDDDGPVYDDTRAARQAPAAAPVIVQAPAPVIVQAPAPVVVQQAPPPQRIIVAPPAEPTHVTRINVNLPGSLHWPRSSRSSRDSRDSRDGYGRPESRGGWQSSRQNDQPRVQRGASPAPVVTVIEPRKRERKP